MRTVDIHPQYIEVSTESEMCISVRMYESDQRNIDIQIGLSPLSPIQIGLPHFGQGCLSEPERIEFLGGELSLLYENCLYAVHGLSENFSNLLNIEIAQKKSFQLDFLRAEIRDGNLSAIRLERKNDLGEREIVRVRSMLDHEYFTIFRDRRETHSFTSLVFSSSSLKFLKADGFSEYEFSLPAEVFDFLGKHLA